MQAKLSITLLVGILIAVVVAVPPSPEEKKKILNECKEQEKASDDDVQKILNHELPEGSNSKCLMACMHEHIGIVKDGKIVADAFKMPPMKNGENGAPAPPPGGAFNECLQISDPDRCELSYKLGECLHKVMFANGPDMKKN